MVYLFFDEDCSLINAQNSKCTNKFFKNAKYKLENLSNENLVFVSPNKLPLTINLTELCFKNCQNLQNTVCFEYKQNFYIFLKFCPLVDCFYTQFSFKGALIGVCLSSQLTISINGEPKFFIKNKNLTFSHFEQKGDFCFIHFVGKTNFVAILKGQEIVFANYYHQVNFDKQEFYFLTRLNDLLNHGAVFHIKDNKAENYLVYLDDYELNLKPEFLACVFLDCLLAKNYKYCNNLLDENLRQTHPEKIADFFCEFDDYCPLEENCCALFKKDALAGIYEFEVLNEKIVNIVMN